MTLPVSLENASAACVDKRQRILDVAESIFFRNGYRGTTLDMICGELGVTKPYVYYYFRNKQEIFETLSWAASVACLTAFRFPADDRRPAQERLAEGLRRFIAANIRNFRSGTFAYRDAAAFRPEFNEKLRDLARGFYVDLGALLEGARAEGRLEYEDTRLTAIGIGSLAGFMFTWYKPDGRLSPAAMEEQLTAMLFKLAGWKR